MLDDAAPKIKTISENLVKTSETLVETSGVAKSSVAAGRRYDYGCEPADAAAGGAGGRHGDRRADDDAGSCGHDQHRDSRAGA